MFELKELLKATGGTLLRSSAGLKMGSVSTDSRTIKKGQIFVALKGDAFDGHGFIKEVAGKGAACVIVDKSNVDLGRIPAAIKVKDSTLALGDLARFHRKRFPIPVIAVTGSNGKTTTKDMLAWVLSKKYNVLKNEGTKNNQIGLPTTLLALDRSIDVAVLEMGTNHFGEIGYLAGIASANIGVITNIGAAHLEYFKTTAGVFKEKCSLLRSLDNPHLAVLNQDDPFLEREASRRMSRIVTVGFGLKNAADFRVSRIKAGPEVVEFSVNGRQRFRLHTVGRYNIYNALAAVTVARVLGMEYKDIARQLESFVFPKGRLSLTRRDRLTFIDDTYNANPTSLACALDSLAGLPVKGRRIFIMGDMRELGKAAQGFHKEAGKNAARVCDVLITVGPLSRLAAGQAKACGLKGANIFLCDSTSEAAQVLFKKVLPVSEDVILVKGSRSMKMEEVFKTNAL